MTVSLGQYSAAGRLQNFYLDRGMGRVTDAKNALSALSAMFAF